jgi:WD40 repeat-containing protein SMU1
VFSLNFIPVKEQFLVGTQSNRLLTIDMRGEETWESSEQPPLPKEVVSVVPSCRGEVFYALSEDGTLQITQVLSKKSSTIGTLNKAIGMCTHPQANVLAIWNEEGQVSLWKS